MHTQYIALDEFCNLHNIEISFISALQQTGLIETDTIEEKICLEVSQLQQIEKFINFYYELEINLEGIETINHLLQRMNCMNEEIITLRNRLRIYETE